MHSPGIPTCLLSPTMIKPRQLSEGGRKGCWEMVSEGDERGITWEEYERESEERDEHLRMGALRKENRRQYFQSMNSVETGRDVMKGTSCF